MAKHKHKWEPKMHADACHYYLWVCVCKCGATRRIKSERNIEADPYSLVWMDDEGRDEPCQRCEALRNGAEPRHEDVIEAAA
jgi:hypothetical protein